MVAIRVECATQLKLRGMVLDPSGAVIANSHVDLYSGKDEWHTTTDPAGRFSFPAVLPGKYDIEVTSPGFRKRIIQGMRIDYSEPASMTITMQVENQSCGNLFSQITYVDATRQSGIIGVISLVSHLGATEYEGKKRVLSGATVLVVRSESKGKGLAARTNENGEFDLAGLEPGLYSLRASRKGFEDFAVENVRVRPGKTLQADFSMRPSGYIVVCQ